MGTLADIFVRVFADDGPAQNTLKKMRSDMTDLSRRAAEVKVKADTKVAEGQVKALKANLEQLERKRVNIPIKASGLDAEIARAKRQLDLLTQKTYEVPLDAQGDLRREILQAERALARLERRRTKIPLEMESISGEIAATEAMLGKLDRKRISIPVDIDVKSRNLQQASIQLAGLLKFPAMAAGAALATGAIGQLTAGVVSLGAAIAPAVGGIAAMPVMLGAAAQGAGTAMAAFMGVGDALKALGDAEAQSGAAAQASAAAREGAARRVADAQRGVESAVRQAARTQEAGAQAIKNAELAVADARRNSAKVAEDNARRIADAQANVAEAHRNASDVAEQGARRVRDAEERLSDSQRTARQAQDDLNNARREAAQDIEDMRMALAGAALSEEDAVLGLRRAKQRLNELKGAGSKATALDLAEAELNVRQAQQRIVEARDRHKDLASEVAAADKRGVEGSERVLNAKQRLADATDGQRKAERGVADARRESARANEDAARREAEAAQGVVRARQQAAEASANAARAESKAVQDLQQTRTEAARANEDAARSVADAQRDLAEAQRDAARSMQQQSAASDKLAQAMAGISPKAREFVRYLNGEWKPALKALQFRIQDTLFPKLTTALQTVKPLLGVFSTGLTGTASVLGDLAVQGARMMASGPWKRDFQTLLAGNNKLIGTFGQAGLSLANALRSVTVAALPMVQRFADFTVKAADVIDKFVQAKRESGELGRFFGVAGDRISQLGRILGNIGNALFNVGKAGYDAGQTLLNSFEGATRKFVDFTGSTDGQNKLKAYFDQAVPAVQAFGDLVVEVSKSLGRIADKFDAKPMLDKLRTDLLPQLEGLFSNVGQSLGPQIVDLATNITELFKNLTADGGGGLEGFVGTLNALVSGVNRLVESPLGPVISQLLKIGGAAVAVGLVAGSFGRLIGVAKTLKGALAWMGLGGKGGAGGGFTSLRKSVDTLRGGFSRLRGVVGGLGGRLASIGRIAGGVAGRFAGFARSIGGGVLSSLRGFARVAGSLGRLLSGALAKGIRVVIIAVRALGIAFITNPIGIVITAIIALGAALFLLYKKNETFRNFINKVWGVIKDAVGAVVTWLKDKVPPAFAKITEVAGKILGWVKDNWKKILGFITGPIGAAIVLVVSNWDKIKEATSKAWDKIKGTITGVWNKITGWFKKQFALLVYRWRVFWSNVRVAARTIWEKIKTTITGKWDALVEWFGKAWSAYKDAAAKVWRSVRDTARRWWDRIKGSITGRWTAISDWFSKKWSEFKASISRVWQSIRDTARTWWNRIKGTITGRITDAIDKVKSVVGRGKDALGKLWDGIRGKFRRPVEAVFRFINKSLIGNINKVTSKVGIPGIPKIPGFAKGGLAKGWAMVGEQGPELVNFTRPGRVYTARQTKEALTGQGGPLDWIGDRAKDVGRGAKWVGGKAWQGTKWTAGKVWDGTKWVGSQAKNVVQDGMQILASRILGPLINKVRDYSANKMVLVKVVGARMVNTMEKIIGKAKDTDALGSSGEVLGSIFGKIKGIVSMVGSMALPLPKGSYRVTSPFGYRTHPITGRRKLHAGLDLAAPYGTPVFAPFSGFMVNKVNPGGYGNYVSLTNGGLTFRGGHLAAFTRGNGFVRVGSLIGRVGSTGASTGPHLHAEFRRGGAAFNPRALMSFDTGGILPHGGAALNTSRKPERILTGRQTESFDRLVQAIDGKGKDQPIEVRVYVGNQEIKDIARVEVNGQMQKIARTALHGRR